MTRTQPPRWLNPRTRLIASTALATLLAGCGSPGPQSSAIVLPSEQVVTPAASAPAARTDTGTPAPVTAASPTSSTSGRPGAGAAAALDNGSTAGEARSFVTQGARYSLEAFADVPGWREDNVVETWPAFRESCAVKARSDTTWKGICDRSAAVDGKSRAAISAFFEREFAAYRIQDAESRNADGVVTGYYETLLRGSRQYRQPFIHPVYGTPKDMVFLDGRRLNRAQRAQTNALARVADQQVTVLATISTRDLNAPDTYVIDLSTLNYTALDRKVRLRAEGRKLVPYYTREEIERLGAPNAPVIAFVDDAAALYETQIQGSGRIQMPDGSTIRVSFAEQNGHAFKPNIAQSAQGQPASKVKLRGGEVELDPDGDDEEEGGLRTRGFKLASLNTPAGRSTPAAGSPAARVTDPSYVFFRESTERNEGPIGALGVPLTAQRSIAVDPRATPLGFPVFISTREPGRAQPLRRLTVAQDTGGAIRGVARADYFFGFGNQARNSARRMKERGQMWVLLPRGLRVAGVDTSVRLRSGAAPAPLPTCLVDDGYCSNDD